MLRKAARHHGPHCLLEENNPVQEKIQYNLEILTCFLLTCTCTINKPCDVYCIESDGRAHVTKEKFNVMESL